MISVTYPEITLRDIVESGDFRLVMEVVRKEQDRYRKDLQNLDPNDPEVSKKAIIASAKIKALRGLARQFYEEIGEDGLIGEEAMDR